MQVTWPSLRLAVCVHAEVLRCRSGHECKRKLTAPCQTGEWGRDQEYRTLGILGCPREADGPPWGCGVGAKAMGDSKRAGDSNREGSPMTRGCGLPGCDGS